MFYSSLSCPNQAINLEKKKIKTFEKAQKLFDAYQNYDKISSLRDSLDILDEIIESHGADCQRAINLKQIIGRHVDSKLNEIYVKRNVDEFGKSLNDVELGGLLLEALSKEDLRRFVALISIKRDYFK